MREKILQGYQMSRTIERENEKLCNKRRVLQMKIGKGPKRTIKVSILDYLIN